MSAQVSLPVYPILESPTTRKGVESLQRERMMRRGEVLWAWGLRVRGEKGWSCQGERVGVRETMGDDTSWVREWRGVVGKKGRRRVCSWQPEKPWGAIWREGAKGQGSLTFDPDPLFSKHPSSADLWVARNNNCQRPEGKAGSVSIIFRWLETWNESKHGCPGCGVLLVSLTSQQLRLHRAGGCFTFHLCSSFYFRLLICFFFWTLFCSSKNFNDNDSTKPFFFIVV